MIRFAGSSALGVERHREVPWRGPRYDGNHSAFNVMSYVRTNGAPRRTRRLCHGGGFPMGESNSSFMYAPAGSLIVSGVTVIVAAEPVPPLQFNCAVVAVWVHSA